MAQRATGRVSTADRAGGEAYESGTEVPLNLAPLLAAHKKRGRLSLRVEGLPLRARLSKGRNNGDRSWSLMSDELDGLNYLPPKGMNSPHNLAIRIFGIDEADGATLAVVEYPIFGGISTEKPTSGTRMANADGAELQRLNAEIAKLKTGLAAREQDLADLQKAAGEQAKKLAEQLEAELSAARRAWESELRDRLDAAASNAAAVLEKSRKAWQAEHQEELLGAKIQIDERISAAREKWRAETEEVLAKAKKTWSDEHAARSTSGQAEKQKQSASLQDALARCERAEANASESQAKLKQAEIALTEAHARAERAEAASARAEAQGVRARSESGERRRLQEELNAVQAQLVAREADLKQLHSEMAREQERWRRESASALLAAESTWKASEAARLAVAEATWRESSGRELEQFKARSEKAESALAKALTRIERAESSVAAARTESQAVAEWQKKAEQAELALAKTVAQLEKAESSLIAIPAEREASGQWKARAERAEAALTQATTRLELTETALSDVRNEADALRDREDAEVLRLRAEASNARAALAKRDEDLAGLRALLEHEREQTRAALSKVEAESQAEEAARFAAAKDAWHEQSATALSEAIARYERAEAESAKIRAEMEALRHEFVSAKTRYAELESGAAIARVVSQPEPSDWVAAPKLVYERPVPREELPERQDPFRYRLLRDMVVVAAVAAAGIALYPRLPAVSQDWSPRNWSPKNVQLTTAMQSFFKMIGGPSDSPESERLPDLPAIIAARSVNLRATPSAGADVVTTLPRDSEVTQIDRRGEWVLVKVRGPNGASRQGWVFSTFLKAPPSLQRTSQSPNG